MFCQIIISNESDSFKTLLKELNKISDSYEIVTDNSLLNNFLNDHGKISRLFANIFPIFSKEDREIKSKTAQVISEYSRLFKNINYFDVNLFETIKNHVIYDIIIYEQIKSILKNPKNYFFIFSNISFIHFSLLELVRELGYDASGNHINHFSNNQIEKLFQNKINIQNNFSKKINFVRNLSKQNKIRSKQNSSIDKVQNMIIQKNSIGSLIYQSLFPKSKNDFLKKFKNKMIDESKNNYKNAIVFTPSREDELQSGFLVVDEFQKNSLPLLVMSFDQQTNKILLNNNIPFLDLSSDLILFSRILKRSNDYNHILTIFKNIIKQNKLSPLYCKTGFSPLVENLFLSCSIIEVCKTLFEILNLKNILISIDGNKTGNSLSYTAQSMNISTYTIMPYSYEPDPLISHQFTAEKIFVGGEHAAKTLSLLNYPDNRIIVSGNPSYDYIKTLDSIEDQKQPIEIDFSKNKKLIVVVLSRFDDNDEIWLSNLIKFCNSNNFQIILKIHPIYKIRFKDIISKKIQYIQENCKTFSYDITFDHDARKLISLSDIVITDNSILCIDAVLNKKFLIRVNFQKSELLIEKELFQFIPHKMIKNYDDLESVLLKSNTDFVSQAEYDLFCSNFNHFNDGKTTQRIFNILTKDN